MKRHIIVLAIEVEDNEKHPSQWIWSSIIDPTKLITSRCAADIPEDASDDDIRCACEDAAQAARI
jgi:hypothetical protein